MLAAMRKILCALTLSLVPAVWAVGCEPNLGSPCDPNEAEVLEKVKVQAGTNDLVRDVGLDSCDQALCASVDGGRPFCTKQCEADVECAEAGDGFTCQEVVSFGELACIDFTPDDLCDADGNGDGFPCDCIDENGEPSSKPKKYCSAPPAVIAARDEEFGRPVFVAP